MKIEINTKFNIGQQVYTCQRCVKFKEGQFIETYIPNKYPNVIKNIIVLQTNSSLEVQYIFKNNEVYTEDKIFYTIEDAQKWCDAYE